MHHVSSTLFAVAVLAFVAGCASNSQRTQFAPDDYSAQPQIELTVVEIRTSSNYRAPNERPHIDHVLPVALNEAATRWAEQRLRATGIAGQAAFVVETAAVIETPIATSPGLGGLLKNQISSRYDGTLDVRLVATDGSRQGELEISVTREATVLENATLDERKQVQHLLVTQMIADLNTEIEREIGRYLGDFLR